ncbi:GGDEF domain-containing protein [Pseudomonas typographi]|nr:diguanylate cyclase [Pseudomonas typographi]MBD1589280.1 diguanylate cyclase [Pseudomonas typographi]
MEFIVARGFCSRYSLQGKLTAGCLVLLALAFLMAFLLITFIGNEYRLAKRNYENLQLYQDVLLAANAISAERGPTNTMLGGDYSPTSETAQRLLASRLSTDKAITEMAEALVAIDFGSKVEVITTNRELAKARILVDRELSSPFSSRTLLSIQDAISGMFSAVDAIRPLINVVALYSIEGKSDIADEALIGQKLFEIRDYAGRLGSILTPYIATHKAIAPADQAKLQQLLGRILQLWELTKPYLARYATLSGKIADVENVFFLKGVALISSLEREGEVGGFTYTTRSMTDAIVPTFAPLEEIRTSYLKIMTEKSNERLADASRWLTFITLIVASGMLIYVVLLLWAHRVIFKPLLQARYNIVALADDRTIELPQAFRNSGTELDEVFKALGVLKTRLAERREITASLRTHALTDGLTGLLNRRAFDQIGDGKIYFTDLPDVIGLILLDIDHFKSVNDNYGHAAGDTVLRAVAKALTTHVRRGDLVARHGGEEFSVVLSGVEFSQLYSMAEKLRVAISKMTIEVSPSIFLNVTASFGIAFGPRENGGWTELFAEADASLYEAKRAGRNCVRCLMQKIS